jgi:hypothetical protein
VAICKKHGISEMECDCPQWSPEAQAVILGRVRHLTPDEQQATQRALRRSTRLVAKGEPDK